MAMARLLNCVRARKRDLLVTLGRRYGRPVMLIEHNKRIIFSGLASAQEDYDGQYGVNL
jgi:hypothetical protein